jgi:two-component system response regulator AtoC
MVALSGPGELGLQAFADAPAVPEAPDAGATEEGPAESLSLKEQLDALERSLLVRTLAATSGNQSEAARRLRISRSALIERLHKYNL